MLVFRDRFACWLEERCQVAKSRYAYFTNLAQSNTDTIGKFWFYFLLAGINLILAEGYYRAREWVA